MSLIEQINTLVSISTIRATEAEAKFRSVLQYVSVETCNLHAESTFTYAYNISSAADAIHASIRAERSILSTYQLRPRRKHIGPGLVLKLE